MEDYETRLETARGKLAGQQFLVDVRRDLVAKAKQAGRPDEVAEKMLEEMEKALAALQADLDRLLSN
jgi:hypothetical protein